MKHWEHLLVTNLFLRRMSRCFCSCILVIYSSLLLYNNQSNHRHRHHRQMQCSRERKGRVACTLGVKFIFNKSYLLHKLKSWLYLDWWMLPNCVRATFSYQKILMNTDKITASYQSDNQQEDFPVSTIAGSIRFDWLRLYQTVVRFGRRRWFDIVMERIACLIESNMVELIVAWGDIHSLYTAFRPPQN